MTSNLLKEQRSFRDGLLNSLQVSAYKDTFWPICTLDAPLSSRLRDVGRAWAIEADERRVIAIALAVIRKERGLILIGKRYHPSKAKEMGLYSWRRPPYFAICLNFTLRNSRRSGSQT